MIDYAAIYSDLYDRAATDSAGSALRALLGTFPNTFPPAASFAGQAAVFPRDMLERFAGKGVTLPWLVWAPGPVSGASREIRAAAGSWWAYAMLSMSTKSLHTIASAVDALYGSTAAYALDGGKLGITHVGQPFPDDKLGLQGIEVRIGLRRLG